MGQTRAYRGVTEGVRSIQAVARPKKWMPKTYNALPDPEVKQGSSNDMDTMIGESAIR